MTPIRKDSKDAIKKEDPQKLLDVIYSENADAGNREKSGNINVKTDAQGNATAKITADYVNEVDANGDTPLHDAAMATGNNAGEMVDILLEAGADLSTKNTQGKTAGDIATEQGNGAFHDAVLAHQIKKEKSEIGGAVHNPKGKKGGSGKAKSI